MEEDRRRRRRVERKWNRPWTQENDRMKELMKNAYNLNL